MPKPLAIDLYAGLGGWAEGLLAEGWDVVGFDIERHVYGEHRYPADLVIQDVLTLHGSQFREASLIVASPPCQEYSYMAMPWRRAKARAAAIRGDESGQMLAELNKLFEACFRIAGQASLAAGRHIPLVVENVRGAQPWVGRARWNYGSYYLWGDVPALMPSTKPQKLANGQSWSDFGKADYVPFGFKHDNSGWRENGTLVSCNRMIPDGLKCGGDWFGSNALGLPNQSAMRQYSSKSPARKAASALIAKIPLPLARHIARVFRP